jgi:hypothetical protein
MMANNRGASERDLLFRPEAIAYEQSFRGPGEPLSIGGRSDQLFWLLLALLFVGLVAAALIQVDGEPLLTILAPPLRGLLGAARA